MIMMIIINHASHDTHTKYFSLKMNLHLSYSIFLTINLFKTTIDKFC